MSKDHCKDCKLLKGWKDALMEVRIEQLDRRLRGEHPATPRDRQPTRDELERQIQELTAANQSWNDYFQKGQRPPQQPRQGQLYPTNDNSYYTATGTVRGETQGSITGGGYDNDWTEYKGD